MFSPMPGTKSRWRRILILFGILTILLGLLVLALPVWFPWLARPVARSLGFTFENYRRVGLSRFEVTGVSGSLPQVELDARRIEAYLPHAWIWARWSPSSSTNSFAQVSDWTVRIDPQAQSDTATPNLQSTLELLDAIDHVAGFLRNWLRAAHLRNGAVHFRERTVFVPELDWNRGILEARTQTEALPGLMVARLDTRRSGHWQAELHGPLPSLTLTADLIRAPNSWTVDAAVAWQSNRVDLAAQFGESGWLPAEAQFTGTSLRIPPEFHRVPQYGPLRGGFAVHWLTDEFTLSAQAQAEPVSTTTPSVWPPLELELDGRGTVDSGTVNAFRARAPWFTLESTEPLTVDYSDLSGAGEGTFALQASLERLNPDWQGQLTAAIQLQPGTNRWPAFNVHLRGPSLAARGIQADDLELDGAFDWPRVDIKNAQVVLGSNTIARAQAVFNLENNHVQSATVEWQGDDLRQLLPGPIQVKGLKAHAEAAGPLDQLSHQGTLTIDKMILPRLNPVALSMHWDGTGLESVSSRVQADAGDARLLLESQVQRPGDSLASLEARLDKLTFEREGQPVYQLEEPVHLRWHQGDASGWLFKLDRLAWTGSQDKFLGLSANLQWPTQGQLLLNASQFALTEAEDFWSAADLPLTLNTLNLEAGWTNGPLVWRVDAVAQLDEPDRRPFKLTARARGDQTGAMVETLTLDGWEATPLIARGALPVAVDFASREFLHLLPEAALEFSLSHQPTEAVELNLGSPGNLRLTQPAIDLRLTGTASQPRGELRASFASASLPSFLGAPALPRLERAQFVAELRPEVVTLKQFGFELEGQPVEIKGEWPLGTNAWRQLITEGTVPDWQTASGRVLIREAELAPVAQRLPRLLTTQGQLHLDLGIQPGLGLTGFLSLSNAMTRPLGPLAPVRDIEALIAFSGRTARVDRFVGRLGGHPIDATGQASLDYNHELLFALRVQSTNAPLIREPGLLLRANLDLALERKPGANPMIGGSIELRDGLLLQDVSALLVDRLERPALRPPYFSITNLPFARWQVNLKVTGDRFLRVRSPAFIGAVSADGTVLGSLAKPVIQADVRIPSGRILFPFGKLEVEGAYATLSGEEPRGPLIDLAAAGHNFSYNVRLEVTGTMDDLNVLFTSTPPLSSEDILLMLTAGELPNQEITYSAEARAGRLITYLGREVATRFFGDEMGEERIVINSGENIARSGRTTYSIEYRLTPRWSLVGEYDEYNALNAGLKWRIYSK
jgi:translocation and assembly module TamB